MSRFVLTAQLQLQAPTNVRQVVQQIQQQLQGVTVNVQLQGTAQTQRQLQQVTQATNQATTAAERMGKAFALSVRRFAAFSIATRAVSLFTSTLGDAVQSAIDFERQLVKVSQVTGKSVSQLSGLTKQITGLATGFGVASSDLLEVSTILAQAGLSADDTSIALRTLAKAALAPNFDSITETAEGAIAILAQFQEGVGSLEKQLGSINAVAGAFAVEASDLIDVIRRTGGVFKASGGDLNELLALFTSVRATTRESAESIGTGLRTIFTRIQRPKTIEFLKQFGVELTDLNGKFVGPYEAVRRLSEALAGLGEGDITFIRIAEELGGFRQIGKVLPLLQQFSTAQAALNVATKAGNSLTQDAESAQAALAIRIMKVKEEFLALIRSVTETSTFQVMANTALSLASALIKIGDAIKPLLPLLAALAAVRLTKGIGSFFGGIMSGATSGRTYNKGGKVLGFARGGLVPGTGNRDTVPAMLSPGEFVIRKSSVNKMGAGTLAAMNENRYAAGGLINENKIGAAILENVGFDSSNIIKVTRKEIENKLPKTLRLSDNYPIKTQKSFTLEREGLSGNTYNIFSSILRSNLVKVAENSAKSLADDLGLGGARTSIPAGDVDNFLRGINDGSIGNLFEDTLKVLSGSPFSTEAQRAFDFNTGISNILKDDYKNITSKYVDAKSSLAQSVPSKFQIKAANALAQEAQQNNYIRQELESERKTRKSTEFFSKKKKHFGGLIQRFADGGVVNRGNINYLKSDIVKAMSGMGLTYDDFFKKIPTPNSGFDQFMVGGIGPGSVPFPRFLKPYVAKTKAQTEMEKAQAAKDERINAALAKRGQTMRDYGDYGNRRRRFASGGGVGTDTVPALLTPGEFVINRSSAQRIGYGNLNRMNKVGRYANGGIVQHFANGTPMAGAQPARSKSNPNIVAFVGFDALAQQASALAQAQNLQTKVVKESTGSFAKLNRSFIVFAGFSAIRTALDSLTPVIDENSSVFQKLTAGLSNGLNTLMATITGVILALDAFGVSLNAQTISNGINSLFDLFTGKGGKIARKASVYTRGAMRAAGGGLEKLAESKLGTMFPRLGSSLNNLSGKLIRSSNSVGKFTGSLVKTAGPYLAAAASAIAVTEGLNSLIYAIYNYEAMLKKSISEGNISKSAELAGKQYDLEAANSTRRVFGYGGGAVGGAVGLRMGGPVGMIIGAALGGALGTALGTLIANVSPEFAEGIHTFFGGNTKDSVVKLAKAQSGAIKTQQDLDKAQKIATDAMAEFEKGAISASEALSRVQLATSQAGQQEQRASDFVSANLQNFGGSARNIFTLGGLLGESSKARNERLGQQNAEQIRQASQLQVQAFQIESAARSAAIRSSLFQDKTPEQIREQVGITGRKGLQARAEALRDQEIKLLGKKDKEGALAAAQAASVLEEQIEIIDKELENLAKEVKATKEKFAALNLGFRSVLSASDATALKMDNLMSSFEAGYLPAAQAAATLEAAMTSAGQNINKTDFDSALSQVNNVFKSFGASEEQINKFNGLLKGVAGVQREFPAIFETLKKELMAGELRDISNPTKVGERFKQIVEKQLENSGIDKAAREQILAAMGEVKLDSEDVSKILSGNYEVLEKYLGDAGEEVKKNMKSVIDNYVKINQQLIEATKKRIDAERNLVEAQKDALDLIMEGREVQAKYGGAAITSQERRQNLLARSNVESNRLGLRAMRTGDPAELRRRNLELVGSFAKIEDNRRRNNLIGNSGVIQDETQKDLQKAYKTQIDTVRNLIKLEEDELKLIQEKNKLEKESLESLAQGDVESFFKQQAAVGARAAIATGNQTLMNLYGSEALSGAALDIQRQQEAGVQTLYGQQVGGPGGLAEAAAAAALSSMGITDMRAAQVMAGTTGEEEAVKSRLRELGGILGETGMAGIQMAEMQVGTATIQAQKAELIVRGGGLNGPQQAIGKARGGLIYANRGIFVPRGTDTVPAMLTPGEFVVNRSAVQRGNNLQILNAMNGNGGVSNNGQAAQMSRGGRVKYFANGGQVQQTENKMSSFDYQNMSKFADSLSSFNRDLTVNIDKLRQTNIHIKLDSTNVNINLNDGGLLKSLKEEVKTELYRLIQNEFKLDNMGRIRRNQSVLGS